MQHLSSPQSPSAHRQSRLANRTGSLTSPGTLIAATGIALAAAAALVQYKTRQAQRAHPPHGQFIEVNGIQLHYVERGQGQPLVLFHGNGSMAEDLELSGLVDMAAKQYRVIVFDRPGFGYSDRPRDQVWTPTAQAQLLHTALQRIGVDQAIVAGHSWGTLVALAMALDYPDSVKSLVLLSGYYYPSVRVDSMISAVVASPVLGDLMRYTVSPLSARLLWRGLLRRVFGPPKTPARFDAFPVWLALRPSQLRAAAEEGKLMIPSAKEFEHRYGELNMPVVILAGSADRIAMTRYQSERLHADVPHSDLRIIPGMGHMVYYYVNQDILAAIDAANNSADAPLSATLHQHRQASRQWH